MEPEDPLKIYVIAGEVSGDLHGKNLVRALRESGRNIEFRGMGGDGMKAEGVSLVEHIRNTNFMGFVQVLTNIRTIQKLFRKVESDILKFKPDVVILIDYPGFNLRLAKFLKEKGIKVFFYISPQVWAWKKSRVKKIRQFVDRMFVILPFEKDFYANENIDVDFVGHPLLDEIAEGSYKGREIREKLCPNGEKLIALLPGSRKQEIHRMLPRMLSVIPKFPEYKFVIAATPAQDAQLYAKILGNRKVAMVTGRTYDVLDAADYALVTSGTATLETALFGVPEVVCYSGPPMSVQIARWLIKVKFISLVNLIMDREVVKELIQKDLNTKMLEAELRKLMAPAHAEQLRKDYRELREKLGNAGASATAAQLMLGYLEG